MVMRWTDIFGLSFSFMNKILLLTFSAILFKSINFKHLAVCDHKHVLRM